MLEVPVNTKLKSTFGLESQVIRGNVVTGGDLSFQTSDISDDGFEASPTPKNRYDHEVGGRCNYLGKLLNDNKRGN